MVPPFMQPPMPPQVPTQAPHDMYQDSETSSSFSETNTSSFGMNNLGNYPNAYVMKNLE